MTFGNNDPAKQRKRSLKSNWRHGPACDGKRASESFARYCERGADLRRLTRDPRHDRTNES